MKTHIKSLNMLPYRVSASTLNHLCVMALVLASALFLDKVVNATADILIFVNSIDN